MGILAGVVAQLMESSLQFGFPRLVGSLVRPGEADELRFLFDWRVALFPALGGLLSGLIIGLLCKPSHAHGTSILIDAFHNRGGHISLWDSLLKAAAAVGVIVCGCSVGKEAPVAVLSASIGSTLAIRLFRMTPREARIFLVAGCAAGVGAIFQCPLGGALFATTILYREPDIESDALPASVISSVVGYSTFMMFGGFGRRLLQGTDKLTFREPAELAAYVFLGLLCALAAMVFFYSLKFARKAIARSRVPRWLAPAMAGLAVGLVACILPQVMDPRYQFLQNSLDMKFIGIPSEGVWLRWTLLFAAVVLAKCVSTALMIGSDSAGGLFGPVVFMGGAVGAAAGAFCELAFPGVFPETLREAMIPVGMAGMLAASLRVPLAAVVMAMEMTGSYGLIVPLMITSVMAYVLGRRWGVYAEQAAGVEHSPAHVGEHVISLLETEKVANLMERHWPHTVTPGTPLPQIVSILPPGPRPVFLVLEGDRLAGVISMADVLRILGSDIPAQAVVAVDMMNPSPQTITPDDDLYSALGLFHEQNTDVLPVVTGDDRTFLGVLTRVAIFRALHQRAASAREALLKEHAGMASLAREGAIDFLVSGLAAPSHAGAERMTVPEDLVGKSLREAEFRKRHGEVIAIQSASGEIQTPPDPGRPMRKDDLLIVLVRPESQPPTRPSPQDA